MAGEQNPNDPRYDWLYGPSGDDQHGAGQPSVAQRGAGQQRDEQPGDEPTQLIRRDGSSAVPAPGAAAGEPEPTRVFRADGPPRGGTPAPPSPMRYAPPPGTRPPPVPSGPVRPRRRRRWWLRVVLALLVAWVLFLVVIPLWAWTKVTKVDAEPSSSRPPETPGTTYLLVGSDSRQGLTASQNRRLGTGGVTVDTGRTDTILMLHIPSGGGPTLLLSIPRDSFVNIPGYGQSKINAAYTIGGPKLLVKTVEANTSVRVDDYIEIGFGGFVKLVDAVGGITICPNQAIDDPKADLNVKKGCQHADGKTALGYSRSRAFPLGDIIRTEHQREVVNATAKKAASWQTVVLPWRYVKVNFSGAESIRVGTNVGPIALTRFAWAVAHINSGKRCVVPYSSLGAATSAGSAVIWDAVKARRLFAHIRKDDTSHIHCRAR